MRRVLRAASGVGALAVMGPAITDTSGVGSCCGTGWSPSTAADGSVSAMTGPADRLRPGQRCVGTDDEDYPSPN